MEGVVEEEDKNTMMMMMKMSMMWIVLRDAAVERGQYVLAHMARYEGLWRDKSFCGAFFVLWREWLVLSPCERHYMARYGF
jgi:hypothetical protein